MSEPANYQQDDPSRAAALDLIANHCTIHNRRVLICNECGWLITWVSKHMAERHGMRVIVAEPIDPERQMIW